MLVEEMEDQVHCVEGGRWDLGTAGHLVEGLAGEVVGVPYGGNYGDGGGTGWAVYLGCVQHDGGHVQT